MKSLLHPVTKWLTRLSEYLITFGAFGLFAVALLDSSFVPLPSSADALMLLLSTTNPSWMLLYAFMATSGSAVGCWILYLVSRRAGARALNRFSEKKQARVKNLIERYDMMAVLVATLLPPPFPFKLFVVTAGVFRFSLVAVHDGDHCRTRHFVFCSKVTSRCDMARKRRRFWRSIIRGSDWGWWLGLCCL